MARPSKPDGERIRDLAPTAVRLPPNLRDALVREAHINGRSLSAEMVIRLQGSFSIRPALLQVQGLQANEPDAEPFLYNFDARFNDAHRMLIACYDGLSPDKQLALITLLRK